VTEQCLDLVALQEVRLRWRPALDRDGGYLLADSEHLRRSCGDVLKEAVQRGEPLVARADVVSAFLLEVSQERDHSLAGQIIGRQARDLAAFLSGEEHEQEADRVAVAAHRAGAQALHGDRVIDEVAVQDRAERVAFHRAICDQTGSAKVLVSAVGLGHQLRRDVR
jgi:hypothetical protein